MSELLIGSGNRREKDIALPESREWEDLTTLDFDEASHPDVLWDLNDLPLPFEAESFDEIHAYEILEHVGQQGDWKTFFRQFDEFCRLLKPGGHFFATTPAWDSMWAFADPGHTRVIAPGSLTFLDREEYEKQVGKTPMTDYRAHYKGDFEIVHAKEVGEKFGFVLKKR